MILKRKQNQKEKIMILKKVEAKKGDKNSEKKEKTKKRK